jgi:hypothetical protein
LQARLALSVCNTLHYSKPRAVCLGVELTEVAYLGTTSQRIDGFQSAGSP